MYDLHLIVMLGKKENYDKYMPYIKENTVGKNTFEIVQVITDFYRSYPSQTEIDWKSFTSFFMICKGKVKPERQAVLGEVLKNIEVLSSEIASDPSKAVLHQDVVEHYVKLDYATKIATKAFEIVNNQTSKGESDDLSVLGDMVHDYEKATKRAVSKESIFAVNSISTLATSVLAGGLNWPLKELNVSIGPLRTGDFVIVGARPETGKSTFGIQCATFFATQPQVTEDRPILYIRNEEASANQVYRAFQSYFGKTAEELGKDMATYDARYMAEIGKKLYILDDVGINNVSQLRKLFREMNPSVIIFDQLDNVSGYSHEDKEHLRIGLLYKWARELAKEYGPVIALTQVDGSGEGQQWITMAQLRESKTDKPAAADVIITIGKTNNKAEEYTRYIHIPKNKLLGLPGVTQEGFRHGYFEVGIDTSIGRYIGKMK